MTPTPRRFLFASALLALLAALGGCVRGADKIAAPAVSPKAAAGIPAAAQANAEPAVAGSSPAASQPVAAPTRGNDALIAAKVETGLAADRNTTTLRIQVDSRGGVVTLRGPAPSAEARARAEEIARNVQGVTSVDNQLNVRAG